MPESQTASWAELVRTAASVRADIPPPGDPAARRRRRAVSLLIAAAGAAIAASLATAEPATVSANSSYDAQLFSLTNQDRTSNGVPSLRSNGTLNGIAEATRYGICGITVAGRAQDMVNRSYFSHYIPPCNQLVFVIMQEAGVHYLSAGENVGWCSNCDVAYINQAFMNSSDHRANILNRNYTDVGMGSASPFNDAAVGASNGWMFAEDFAQLGATVRATPRPTAPPPPPPVRNTPAPTPPLPTPVVTVAPTAVPTPTPVPSANPFTTTIGPGLPPPLIYRQGGLLSDSVESVLESYLID